MINNKTIKNGLANRNSPPLRFDDLCGVINAHNFFFDRKQLFRCHQVQFVEHNPVRECNLNAKF
jgi:hypothetical protein